MKKVTEISVFGLHIFTIIGAILILVGTLLIHSGNQLKSKNKIETLETQLNSTKTKLTELKIESESQVESLTNLKELSEYQAQKLNDNNSKIEKLSNENIALSSKLSKTTIELNKAIMGEGYCIFGLTGDNAKGAYYGSLKSISSFNLYDVSILVSDFDKLIKCKTERTGNKFYIDHDCFWQHTSEDKTSNIPSKSVHFPKISYVTKEDRKHLEIKITTRSTRTLQQSIFELKDDHCTQSYRFYEFIKGDWKLIREENNLGVSSQYWSQHFFEIDNRQIQRLNVK